MTEKFSITARIKSFSFAFAGLKILVTEQHNARIHLMVTIAVVILAYYFQVTVGEWLVFILIISIVWLGEALNSAIEYLADAAVPEQHPLIKKAKDVAAAGVFISAVAALIIGILIFLPYIRA